MRAGENGAVASRRCAETDQRGRVLVAGSSPLCFPLSASMAFHVQVDVRWQVGIIRFAGRVTGREIVRAIGALLAHPQWKPGYARLADSAGVAVMDVMPDEMEAMMLQEHAEFERIGGGRKAMVVPPRLIDIAQMYKISVERSPHPHEVEVFTDERRAWHWLCGPCVEDEALTRL